MTPTRFYDLMNQPWIHGPRWWRAHRYSKARARQLDAEHIAWARRLVEEGKQTDYPASEVVKRMPCKCGHTLADHDVSPDMSEVEPCAICEDCTDFWADFEGGIGSCPS